MGGSLILIAVLIFMSAFFSGSEIAYASVNKLRLKKSAEDGGAVERTALYISDNYDSALSTILLLNNLVNIAVSSVSTVLALQLAGGSNDMVAVATAVITVLIIIFGEITPKIAGRAACESITRLVAYPIRFMMFITYPVIWIMNKLLSFLGKLWGSDEAGSGMTEDELVTIIEMVEDEGVIDEDRSELLQSAIEFSDISVQEIITPRVDMIAVDIEDSFEEIAEVVSSSPYSRIPVYSSSIDNIVGILYVNHFYKEALNEEKFDIHNIMMEVLYLPKSLKLPNALNELKKRQQHIAVVTDEYGGTLGIVTMEDILEQLVGEIWDETDEVENDFEQLDENVYLANGDMSIYEFLQHLDIDEDTFEGDYTTVGGWCIESLGRFPSEGDSFTYRNLDITVAEVDDKRVKKIKVLKHQIEEDE